jgi:carboxylate-amine ligase
VCADIKEARGQLLQLRQRILELGQKHGFKVAAAGTHPFSRWEEQAEPLPRYRMLADDAQMIVRRMLAFGLHIHIGVEDRELAVDVMNTMRYMMPHILCLSTSSPFWQGRNTGLKSYRSVLLDALPRTGTPNLFRSY